jgi:protein ImuB
MFACLYLPPPARERPASSEIVRLARDFSPRVETHGARTVTLDISGLGSLLGDVRAIGEELRRTAADRALHLHIAIASTITAAILLAHSRAGLVIIPPGGEAAALAPLPLAALDAYAAVVHQPFDRSSPIADLPFRRWGLRTLGDLAAIPPADLSERLGQPGVLWHRWACGEDARPLVPAGVDERFEESLDLEWPIDDLEPLSFVIARLCDSLCERLERRDRGAVGLRVTLTLVTKAVHARSLELPAPMRDTRVLRMLALVDLESNPPPAAIDRVTIGVDVTEGRVLQFGLFARALPAERLTTLLARLGALMGSDRVGAPALVDSYRPGAFAMATFEPSASGVSASGPDVTVCHVLRRFRSPIPARVTLEQGRPVRVITDRRGISGGTVEHCNGPWRSSGDWWAPCAVAAHGTDGWAPGAAAAHGTDGWARCAAAVRDRKRRWYCDEWDVRLNDGVSYRISQAREGHSQWFVDGILD